MEDDNLAKLTALAELDTDTEEEPADFDEIPTHVILAEQKESERKKHGHNDQECDTYNIRVCSIDHTTKKYNVVGDSLVSDFLKEVCADFHLNPEFFLFKCDGCWISLRKTFDESLVPHTCDFKLRMRWFKFPTNFMSFAMLKQFYYHAIHLVRTGVPYEVDDAMTLAALQFVADGYLGEGVKKLPPLVKNFSKKFIESHKELNFTEKLKEKIKDIKSMKFQPYDECLKNPVEILEDERVSITEGNKPMIARTKSDNETAEEAQASDECYLTDSAIKAMKNYLCFLRSTPVRQGTAFPITGTTGALRMGVVVDDGVAVFFPNKDFLFWNVTDIVRITGDGAGNIMLVLAHRTGDAVIKFAISPTAEKEFVALVSGYALLFTSFTASPELVPPQDLIPVAAVAQLKPRRGLSLFRTRIDQLFSLLRTTKLTPAACALLAEAPEHLKAETNWEELDLSNSGVNAETLQSLATAFTAINASREKLDCVENFDPVLLDLSHNKNGDGFIASVKDIVRSMPSITKLNLSYTELTVDSASSLKFLMSQRDFTSVSFAGNNAIPNTLLSSLETFKGSMSLLELNLSNCGIKSDKLFAALLELPALRELDLSSNKLDAGKLAKFMRKVSTLKALNVSGTLLKPSQVRKILEESPSRLTKLTARGMDLTPKFFASLSTMMQGGYPLETLDIGENKSRSGTEGALTLPRLKSLNLYAAAFPKSVSSVLPALKTGAISKLCLRACALSRESAVALLAALAESTTLEVLDLSANDDLPTDAVCALVTKCTSLRTLLLSATSMFVEPAAVEQLFAALAQSALTNLSLNNCKLSPKGVEALCAQLPNVKTLEVLSVRGAPLDQTLGTAFFKACKSAARLRKIDVTGAVGISDAYKISRKIGKSVIANGFRNDLLK